MKQTIVGYGEVMLRLTPNDHGSLIEQSDVLKMAFAGAEANILCNLACLGHTTQFVSSFPKNPIGRSANQFLHSIGVGTNFMNWDEGRMGTYFIEHGTSIRSTRVTYDRTNSSVSKLVIAQEVWGKVLSNASYLVLTGITPALSAICKKNIETALVVAKKEKVKVVFDLNYRRTLWPKEEAKNSFVNFLPYVDLLFANIGSAYDVFNIPIKEINGFTDLEDASIASAKALYEFGDFDMIGMTIRQQNSAQKHLLGGLVTNGTANYLSSKLSCEVVDRLGGGDAFVTGVLHGLIRGWNYEKMINFATAAFATTQTLKGDINYMTEEELLAISSGDTLGFIKR